MAFVETVDFTGDSKFGSDDLDISWAYLQVRRLYDLELADNEQNGTPMTITENNFLDKAIEQYEKNKTAGIAENISNTVWKLPGEFLRGAPAPAPKMAFKHYIQINDPTSGNDILDSATGSRTSTFKSSPWLNPTTVDGDMTWFGSTNEFSLDDMGSIRSDRNWAIYIKGQIRSLNNVPMIKKGSFKLHSYIVSNKMNCMVQAAAPSGESPQKTYHAKTAEDASTFVNKTMELLLVRDGLSVRLFVNGVELPPSADQPDPIMVDRDKPVVFPGTCWKSIEKIYVTEPTVTVRDLITVNGQDNTSTHSYSFAHDMDITNSFYSFKQYFPDKFGNFSRIFNTKYGGGASAQTMWSPPPSGKDISNGYVAKSTCLKLGTMKDKEYCNIPSVDWRGDFTISFWFNGSTTFEKFFRIGSATGEKLQLQWDYRKTSTNALRLIVDGTTKYVKMPSLGPGAGDKWQHLAIVKCGTRLTVFPNFAKATSDTWDNITISSAVAETWQTGVPRFYCSLTSQAFYVSHVRVLPYALVNIPHNNKNRKSSFPELQTLNDPVEPGKLT